MGDINFDGSTGQLSNSKWKHTVEIHDLQQVMDQPTRVTAHFSTLIDHFYVSNTDHLSDVTVPCTAISDHTSKKPIKRKDPQTIQYRCFKTFSDEIFLRELSSALQTFNVTQNNAEKNSPAGRKYP